MDTARKPTRVALSPEKEGNFALRPDQIIAQLHKYLGAKYAIDAAYRSFADRVKGPWRDSLFEHWDTHAKEERQAAYDLAMKIVSLGGDPAIINITVPACEATLQGFMGCLVKMELDAVENGRTLISMAGDNTSLIVMAENLILQDTQHLDDLIRMMP